MSNAVHAVDIERAEAKLVQARERTQKVLAERERTRSGLVSAAQEIGRALLELSQKADERRAQVCIVEAAFSTADAELKAEEDRFLLVAPERSQEIERVRAERNDAEIDALRHAASPAGFRERAFDALIASAIGGQLRDEAEPRIKAALEAAHAAALEARKRGAFDVIEINTKHVDYARCFARFMSTAPAERNWSSLAMDLNSIMSGHSPHPPHHSGIGHEEWSKILLDSPLANNVHEEVSRRARMLGDQNVGDKRPAVIEHFTPIERNSFIQTGPVGSARSVGKMFTPPAASSHVITTEEEWRAAQASKAGGDHQ